MINFIKIKDKNENIHYINIKYIICIEQIKNGSIIILNSDIVSTIDTYEEPSYIFNLIHGEILCKNSNI